jgi:hypothetical protein
MQRREFIATTVCGAVVAGAAISKVTPAHQTTAGKQNDENQLSIERTTIVEGDANWDWTQARTAIASPDGSSCLTTMSQTKKVGSHGYHDVYISVSRDRGRSWSRPKAVPSLARARQADGYEVVAGDLWPKWHVGTRKVLITGKTFNFEGGTKENFLRERVSYAVIDPLTGECGALRMLDLPQSDSSGQPIIAPNAGCHQRVDLPNGEILLPIRYQRNNRKRNYTTIVARCRFDGEALTYVEHGSEHSIPTRRGLYEPSTVSLQDRFFLTMRADDGALVSQSSDGINYTPHKPWTFDDGQSLGSYNTQQHWATIVGKLYLIYTRRGANNDHIMRHRAPLFIAEVDPEKLVVNRSTEQILVPENHATLGNSGVCRISDTETWVRVADGRVCYGPRKGETNNVFRVKISL